MTMKLIKCEESTIDCFLKKVLAEDVGTIVSIQNFKNRKASIVLGKVIKFINTTKPACVKILVREVLPEGTYGVRFLAVIYDNLSKLVTNAALCTGDRLGFVEPCVFNNPAFEPREDVEYILEIGGNKDSLMLYAKKQYILAIPPKSKDTGDKVRAKETRSPSKIMVMPDTPDTRQKPHIQLPVNPQLPSNTQRLNPRYLYKNLARVKADALLGDLRRVNIIAVVSEITKGLSKTSSGKFTIICKLVDDSVEMNGELINFDLHFFTPEPTIISQIEQGDILRIHRVKMELYMDDVDGRIFNSQDVVLFKKNSPVLSPLSTVKNVALSDEDKRIILHLKNWYKEEYGTILNSLLRDITLLSSIRKEGDYNLVCKIVSQPVVENSRITLCVTDGSVMQSGAPKPCCHSHPTYDLPDGSGHLVTDIEVFERLDDYAKIKVNDYVFLRLVKATKSNETHLKIPTFTFPMVLESKLDAVLQLESRLGDWVQDQSHNNEKICSDDSVEIAGATHRVQDVLPSNDKSESEKISNQSQVACNNLTETKDSTVNKIPTVEESSTSCLQPAVVKLVRLTSDECANSKCNQQRKNKRKNSIEEKDVNVSDLEDASTVVNLTLESRENKFDKNQRNKKLRLETDSIDEESRFLDNIDRGPQIITHKVSSWLTRHEEKDADDLDMATVHQLMFSSEYEEAENLSSFISCHVRRLAVFLLQVVPDPSNDAHDLVSGFCLEGCQQMFLYTTIHWMKIDNEMFPFCPSCKKTELDKKLTLMFMLQLNVMDRNGSHHTAIVCREHGETFFGCSVKEFVEDAAVRLSRVQLLLDNTVFQSSRSGPFTSPVLDLSVVAISDIFCVVNSKLKLPPNP